MQNVLMEIVRMRGKAAFISRGKRFPSPVSIETFVMFSGAPEHL